jgi:5S rRNA maturation endonuclease (ribonuclease M5)
MNLPPGQFISDCEYRFDVCPSCCKEIHFFYNVKKKQGVCHKCGYTLFNLKDLEDVEFDSIFAKETYAHKSRVKGHSKSAWADYPSRYYLVGKGVSKTQCLNFGIEYEPGENRLRIPIDPIPPEYPKADLVRYFKCPGSKWIPEPGTHKLNYIFNRKVLDKRKRVMVCEGIFDILSSKMDDYAVSTLGTEITNDMLTLFENHEIIVWFDYDAAGRKGTRDIVEAGRVWGFPVTDLTNVMKIEPKKVNPDHSRYNRDIIELLKREMDNAKILCSCGS